MKVSFENNHEISKIYVVFTDNTSLWWLRFLKKGFRHCYLLLVLSDETTVMELNPMSNQIFLKIYQHVLVEKYISMLENSADFEICLVKIGSAPKKCAPIMLFTCVEFIKRFLGLHKKSIITPYQLFKTIHKCRK